MNNIQQIIEDMDKQLSLIECVCKSSYLMEAYNITEEFNILWNIYNKLKEKINTDYE